LTAKSGFITIAEDLGRSVESIPEALQILANTKQSWLLILDNADDPNFDYQNYLPSGTKGTIIITSRLTECRQYSSENAEALKGLEDQDSKELLFRAADIPRDSWLSYDSQAEEVVRLLGSHTLALIQAGVYVRQNHCQLDQYPDIYRRQRKRLLKYRPKQAQSRYCDVYTTFEASAEVLMKSQNEDAKDALHLLEILSMLNASILPLQIIQDAWEGCGYVLNISDLEMSNIYDMSRSHLSRLPSFMEAESNEWDPYRLTEAISLLSSLSLVTRHDLGGLPGLSMHALAHAWAKDRQHSEQQGVAWITAGCVLAFSRSNTDTWQTEERRLTPHVLSYLDIEIGRIFSYGIKATISIIPILLKCGWILLSMRQDSKLSHLLEDMFMQLGNDPQKPLEESLPLYDLHARSLLHLGKNTEAVELLQHVVQIRETKLAEDHPDRLGSQHELARAYQATGQLQKTVELLQHVVQIRETKLAEDHPNRLASQHELAGTYQANGQVQEAVELLQHVVQIKQTKLAEDHLGRLASQHMLGSAYQANGQEQEAVKLLQHVVQMKETKLAEDHPDRLASQHELAGTYQANGQVQKAVELLQHVVQIKETKLAEDHPSRLASQHALGSAYQANGQVQKAFELLQHVVRIRETKLAEDHPDLLASQHELAVAYEANGQVQKAVELLQHVVQIGQAKFGKAHPVRVASEESLAFYLQRQQS